MMPAPLAVEDGELLVIALTRPAMIGGLTLESIGISFYLPAMAALVIRSLWPLLVIPLFLLVSYLVCLKDVFLFSIALAATHCKNCANRRYWGCRSYAPR